MTTLCDYIATASGKEETGRKRGYIKARIALIASIAFLTSLSSIADLALRATCTLAGALIGSAATGAMVTSIMPVEQMFGIGLRMYRAGLLFSAALTGAAAGAALGLW
jgi:hypothetical protein